MTARHNQVHGYFQNLSRQINNAAISNPDMVGVYTRLKQGSAFYADSASVLNQLHELKTTIRGSINIRLVDQLAVLIHSELDWILKNNVPDSIKLNKSSEHTIPYIKIDSLINEGINRTQFLITYGKSELDENISSLRTWTTWTISISFCIIILTSVNLLKERARRKLKEDELTNLLNSIQDSVISVSDSWRYTFLNEAALSAHTRKLNQIIGKTIWDIHPEMEGSVFQDRYREAMQFKKTMRFENYFAPRDKWFSVIVYPSHNGLTIFYRDVTEEKQVRQKLLETEKEIADYKFALDSSSIVAITDQKGIIRYVNDNFCKISNYSREELIGQDHRITNSGTHDSAFFRDLWVSISNGSIWKGEIKNKAKGGSVYWVDTTIVPFLNEQGKLYQYMAIRSDITERKRVQEKLVQSEKIYKTIVSNIPGSVICLIDTDYRYLLVEGDMLEKLGYSKKQLLGNRAPDVLGASVFEGLNILMKKAFQGETIKIESDRMGYYNVHRFIPLKDENDKIYAIMTVSIDITDLKKAQYDIDQLNRDLEEKIISRTEQLRKSAEEMEAFCYSVSHDLRSPLRGIIGFSTILEEDHMRNLNTEGKRVVSVIKRNTMKMGDLIDDLLSFSRLGKQVLLKIAVDTEALLQSVISELQQSLPEEKNILWKIHSLPVSNADIKSLRQVWMNLLSNAIKYSSFRARPSIEIGSHQEKNDQVFYIRDNGVGFNEAYSNKLFKVFQRLHSADEFEGTGVGLAIVEKIISRHGGRVWAEGEEDKGACFYFSIPV